MRVVWLLPALCVAGLVSCPAATPAAAPSLAESAPAAVAAAPRPVSRDYQLQPGDIIRIQVFQEPDLDRELRVSQDGEVVFPLIGRVIAKDRSLSQIEQIVREAYDRDFLVNPQINIAVLKYRVRTINVMGQVNQPQALEYPPEQKLTLVDAISRAGGFNRLADQKRVKVTRTQPDGRVENVIVNVAELISAASKEPWLVQPEDLIYVPERVL